MSKTPLRRNNMRNRFVSNADEDCFNCFDMRRTIINKQIECCAKGGGGGSPMVSIKTNEWKIDGFQSGGRLFIAISYVLSKCNVCPS